MSLALPTTRATEQFVVEIDERLIPSNRDKTEPGLQVYRYIQSDSGYRPDSLSGDEISIKGSRFISTVLYFFILIIIILKNSQRALDKVEALVYTLSIKWFKVVKNGG